MVETIENGIIVLIAYIHKISQHTNLLIKEKIQIAQKVLSTTWLL